MAGPAPQRSLKQQFRHWAVGTALATVLSLTALQIWWLWRDPIMATEPFRRVVVPALVSLLVGAGLLAIFAWDAGRRARQISDGLRALREYIARWDRGEPPVSNAVSGVPDIDEIAAQLAALLRRLEHDKQQLEFNQKLAAARLQEADEYTYAISHDLKEPLRSIDAFSKFLLDGCYERLDEDGRHQLDVIRHSALRMQRLINDLLQFSRLSQQKRPLETVSLNKLLMHVRDTLDFALTAKHVELRVGKLPKIVCDPTAMTAVFHNLISNAIKYNQNPAPLVVVGAIESSHPDTQAPEDVFFVRDNGIGIPRDAFDRIFQIFQRLQRDEEGTGIGLAIVKRVIEWHGGRLWLDSEEGRGSTFYFALPKRPISSTDTSSEIIPPAAQGEPARAPTI